ncbi:MAG: adenine deaminase [Verrucomicrobia bacterium]|nr:adenine deaminase [Verrucomicrobiota bacterium]
MEADGEYSGQIVDVVGGRIFGGKITVSQTKIASIAPDPSAPKDRFFLPGFVDAHVHIESSMLTPVEFARAAVVHGTVATVSDPHEIANVCGLEGVAWMLANAAHTPLKIYFGAPSCVPATPFERAGARFGLDEVRTLLSDDRILYLSEVMNFPAVIAADEFMLSLIKLARTFQKKVDGHAPGVLGDALRTYAAAGIETDHECTTLAEGRERIALGMKVAIREGSAARNFEALWPLLLESPEACFFCSDDKHPDDLVRGYLQHMVARAVANGVPAMAAIKAATLNPVRHYGLQVGLLQAGDPADFIEVANLTTFEVRRTCIAGFWVSDGSTTLLPSFSATAINTFSTSLVSLPELRTPLDLFSKSRKFPVIVARDGQLVTGREDLELSYESGFAVSDPSRDLLKIAVYNRYEKAAPAIGFIKNFGLKTGAMASSVAHDSHNIVAVGVSDEMLMAAINAVVANKGGLAFCSAKHNLNYPLPVAGLMGLGTAWEAASAFEKLTALAKADGCNLTSPYMTLSFMSLLVIPSLKIGDRGLFDVDKFCFVTGSVSDA